MSRFKGITLCAVLIAGLLMTQYTVFAQKLKFGLKAGVNSSFVDQDLTELEGQTLGEIAKEANFGFHGGIYSRLELGPILLQPELLITSKKDLDIPILLGFKLGPVRLNAGPMARFAFDHKKTALREGDESKSFLSSSTYGAQAGMGLDLKKIAIDLRYETNLTALGDEVKMFGKTHSLYSGPPQVSLSLGYTF